MVGAPSAVPVVRRGAVAGTPVVGLVGAVGAINISNRPLSKFLKTIQESFIRAKMSRLQQHSVCSTNEVVALAVFHIRTAVTRTYVLTHSQGR